ncbi:hypothetical protein Mgra_00006530, partial [Meloidogyne graminicola]
DVELIGKVKAKMTDDREEKKGGHTQKNTKKKQRIRRKNKTQVSRSGSLFHPNKSSKNVLFRAMRKEHNNKQRKG